MYVLRIIIIEAASSELQKQGSELKNNYASVMKGLDVLDDKTSNVLNKIGLCLAYCNVKVYNYMNKLILVFWLYWLTTYAVLVLCHLHVLHLH